MRLCYLVFHADEVVSTNSILSLIGRNITKLKLRSGTHLATATTVWHITYIKEFKNLMGFYLKY
jgi:hypothetical protein